VSSERFFTPEEQMSGRATLAAALRSGAYTQITGAYHDLCGGHCALGVGLAVLGGRESSDPSFIFLRRRLGLTKADFNHITMMNDQLGKSFSEIAEYIETLPEPM
jgi:hypothetical protein